MYLDIDDKDNTYTCPYCNDCCICNLRHHFYSTHLGFNKVGVITLSDNILGINKTVKIDICPVINILNDKSKKWDISDIDTYKTRIREFFGSNEYYDEIKKHLVKEL